MNILLLEDEKDLSTSAVMQLEAKGHQVTPVYDIAEARDALGNPEQKFQVVIADHQLPDGFGIHFVESIRDQYPHCAFAIVSGCLVTEDVDRLERAKIPYFRKPLLYAKVLDEVRRLHCMNAPVMEAPEDEPDPEAALDEEPELEPKPKKRKKLFGLF